MGIHYMSSFIGKTMFLDWEVSNNTGSCVGNLKGSTIGRHSMWSYPGRWFGSCSKCKTQQPSLYQGYWNMIMILLSWPICTVCWYASRPCSRCTFWHIKLWIVWDLATWQSTSCSDLPPTPVALPNPWWCRWPGSLQLRTKPFQWSLPPYGTHYRWRCTRPPPALHLERTLKHCSSVRPLRIWIWVCMVCLWCSLVIGVSFLFWWFYFMYKYYSKPSRIVSC